MSERQDHTIISKYFEGLSEDQTQKFQALGALYQQWNEAINVISRKDIEDLYIRHVLHSLAIAKYIEFLPESRIIDLGTGGGFPGIPLAILFPKVQFLLVDSIGKKVKVVDEVAKSLELNNIRTKASRVESIDEKFDFIVTRAVARSAKLKNWTKGMLLKSNRHEISNGIIALKGGDLSEELGEVKSKKVDLVNISSYFTEPFFETKQVVYIGG